MDNQSLNFPQGKAALFSGQGLPFEFIKRQVPVLKLGEILIKTLYTTLCGSDIHTYCGRRMEPARVVLGHEIVGDILWIEAGHPGLDLRGEEIKIGDRVTWSIFSVPEGVPPPRSDIPQKSDRLFKYGHSLASGADVFNGGLADYCILRSNTALIKISKSITLKVAATISCAHSTVMGALRVAGDVTAKRILVFGSGLLGLSCVSMCRQAHAKWIGIIDKDPKRMLWAKRFGADHTFLFPEQSAVNILPWPPADLVFDMTGNPQAMKMGIDSLDIGGACVWIGAVFPEKPVEVDAQQVVRKILQIRGLHNYNYDDFLNATTFIEKNYQKYPFEDLIEKEFSLDNIDEAFEFASKTKPVRVGIKISEQD
jgi:putative phosphonate catabolism associated alcohol dehydrogenase